MIMISGTAAVNAVNISHNNQSIYANTIALPKMNGNVLMGRGAVNPPTSCTTTNGLNRYDTAFSTVKNYVRIFLIEAVERMTQKQIFF